MDEMASLISGAGKRVLVYNKAVQPLGISAANHVSTIVGLTEIMTYVDPKGKRTKPPDI
ncbi:hypothetical protein HRbin01_01058 [archaeon HR01]|nr:hypothetical protein HRbin01_01058 [archaeon HR01]